MTDIEQSEEQYSAAGRLFKLADQLSGHNISIFTDRCFKFSTASLQVIGETAFLERVKAKPRSTFLMGTLDKLLEYGKTEKEIEGAIRLIFGS
jgi:hypothetical protein